MIQFCKRCYVPSTRPRIEFNAEGICNACQWNDIKKTINWTERQDHVKKLCDKYRSKDGSNDVIVGFSGGKDSIYVAYKMKELGMNPLLVTVLPHMETPIGKWNRENMCKDFDRLNITLDEDKYKDLARKYFIEEGRPKKPWETAISAVVINQAFQLGIPFVMYGEEGEMEYGGSWREKDKWMLPVDQEYLKSFYWLGEVDWTTPNMDWDKVHFTQWSRFENWSPAKHREFAVGKGMRTEPIRSIGTFTCDSQLSDYMQNLHTYMMFVKFGFGRCTSDVAIGRREGWIKEEEGLEWIEQYDGEFDNERMGAFLDYFKMNVHDFAETIAKHANTTLLEQVQVPGAKHIWYLKRWVAKHRRRETPQEYISPGRYDFN